VEIQSGALHPISNIRKMNDPLWIRHVSLTAVVLVLFAYLTAWQVGVDTVSDLPLVSEHLVFHTLSDYSKLVYEVLCKATFLPSNRQKLAMELEF
jgi:hypothetical protein